MPNPVDTASPTCDGKSVQFHVRKARAVVRGAFSFDRWQIDDPWKKSHQRRYNQQRDCLLAGTGKQRKNLNDYKQKKRKAFFKHQKKKEAQQGPAGWCSPDPIASGGGCWEIPISCVLGESDGSWTAVGDSGNSLGPYQFYNKPVPWPVDSYQDALAHHRLAESMYAASGLGPWFAPGC